MMTLITGGSGSGKSAFAESGIVSLGAGRRIYIATMMAFDKEGEKRIERHRRMRRDKNFETIECYTDLQQLQLAADDIVLLECMSNLVANEMFSGDRKGRPDEVREAVVQGVIRLRGQVQHLCIVTNEIFSDGLHYAAETAVYQQVLGEINQHLAALADQVVEVVYGIPIYIKKEEHR